MVDAQSLLDSVRRELGELWLSAGASEEWRRDATAQIDSQLVSLLEGMVQNEKQRQETFAKEVPMLEEELEVLLGMVGERSPADSVDPSLLLIPRHAALLSRVSYARALVKERKAMRAEREAQLEAVLAELSFSPGEREERAQLFASEPSEAEAGGLSAPLLERVRKRLSSANGEKASRIDKAAMLAMGIERLREELGVREPSATPPSSELSSAALASRQQELEALEAEAERRRQVLEECSEYIRELQLRLHLPPNECTSLPQPERGLSPQVLEAYHAELERLEALKAKSLSKLLREARERLKPLWKELHFSEEQTRECAAAWIPIVGEGETTPKEGEATEEALFAVEEEERRLQAITSPDLLSTPQPITSPYLTGSPLLTSPDHLFSPHPITPSHLTRSLLLTSPDHLSSLLCCFLYDYHHPPYQHTNVRHSSPPLVKMLFLLSSSPRLPFPTSPSPTAGCLCIPCPPHHPIILQLLAGPPGGECEDDLADDQARGDSISALRDAIRRSRPLSSDG